MFLNATISVKENVLTQAKCIIVADLCTVQTANIPQSRVIHNSNEQMIIFVYQSR